MEDWQIRAWRAAASQDLYRFARWMFLAQRRYKWQQAKHHPSVCAALERVFNGQSKRLILNLPPRYSKTALVQAFIAWSLGHAPDSEFIYTSYSGRLAAASSYAVRTMLLEPEYKAVFPAVALKDDSQAKDEWRTTAGGMMYAVGAGGTITGYGAGKHRPGFGGCFPVGTRVWTESGMIAIDRIVRERMAINVWSFDYAGGMVLRPVIAWHENPPNDIWRLTFDDGEIVECTPDHRFWTSRGWVRADSLGIDDRLPRVYGGVECLNHIGIYPERTSCGLDSSPIFPARPICSIGESECGVTFGQFGAEVGFLPSESDHRLAAGDGLPCVAAPDLIDYPDTDAILFRQVGSSHPHSVVDNQSLNAGEEGFWVNVGLAESAMPFAVHDVCRARVVAQIGEAVVGGVAVEMTDVISDRSFTNEGPHHKRMDGHANVLGVSGQDNAKVTTTVPDWIEQLPSLHIRPTRPSIGDRSGFASDIPNVADGVEPFISGYRKPVLVERVRHEEVTFCITVDEYHNFTIESGFVVKNCILIDDPLKADEARSEVMRGNLIDWYKDTLQSRVNSPETPIIYIGQRLHENDLAGWLLNGGSGEQWEHVCFPAIQPDGTALWPEKHTIEDLRRMEQSMPYTFAGQYMQRPAPLDGGIFKPHKLEVVDAIPAGSIQWVRGWDFAATTDGDWTAGALLGRLPDGRFIIADMVRVREGPDERDATLKATAARDGRQTLVSLPQDPGQAGKTQVAYLLKQLAGFRVQTSPETGDKVTRAEPFAAQVNVGNVLMLRASWNELLMDEMRMFPNGSHDDQIDALSRAFAHLIGKAPMHIDKSILRGLL